MNGQPTPIQVWTVPWSVAGAQSTAGELVVQLVATLPASAECKVKLREAEIAWSPGSAWVVAVPATAEALFPGLAEFAAIEHQLRALEREIEAAWPGLEQDRALVFDTTPADLRRSPVLAERVGAAFARRIRLARLGSLGMQHGKSLAPPAEKLMKQLLEASEAEARIEVLDGYCDVFEHIYEIVSQRLGEYRASRQTERVEWIIIMLLAAELLLMLIRRV